MKKITVIGGDRRLIIAKKELEKAGYSVDSIGLVENDDGDFYSSDVLLFPVPTTRDKETVFCPITNKIIPLKSFEGISGKLLLSANYKFDGSECIDYCKSDSYSLLNAVPTAEGAISFAIENTPYTLWKSRVLVIGYGRTGKVLADRLKALGCNVTVSARKGRDFAFLDTIGINHLKTEKLDNIPLQFDIIFNTVDTVILDNNLKNLKNCLLIDISSKGGFNYEKAKELGITCKKLPGIPGKCAPETAGKILAKTVIDLLEGENI